MKESPSFNHQHLEEFQIKGRQDKYGDWESDGNIMAELMKYLENCPNLKILKIEYEGAKSFEEKDNNHVDSTAYIRSASFSVEYFIFEYLESNPCGTPCIFSCMKFQNLEELHFIGFDFGQTPEKWLKMLNTFHKNLPKLRRLCFMFQDPGSIPFEIFQKFASEKNIKIEISSVPEYDLRVVLVDPSKVIKIFKPEQGGKDLDGEGLDEKDLGEPEKDSDEEDELDEDGEGGKEDEGDD